MSAKARMINFQADYYNLNLLMSTLALNRQLRTKRQAQIEPYRRLLDLQAKQKFYTNSRLRRLQTEPEYPTPYYSSSTQNITITEKKLIQYSTFLPAIKKKDNSNNFHSRRLSLNDEYNQGNPSNTIDTQYQAMQHINECQTIIENLKKLTNYNKVRADKIQSRYLSPKIETKMSNYNDLNRSSPSVQRQPSFFRSSGQNFQHPYALNKRNSKVVPLKKYEGIFQQGLSKIQPTTKAKRKSQYEQFGEFDSRLKQQSDEQNMQSQESRFKTKNSKRDKKDSLSSARLNQQDSYSMQEPDTIIHQHGSNFSLKEELEQDQQSHQNINEQEEAQRQRKLQQQQQLNNSRKRQKFLLKYLMKAKNRGSQLQKKIMQHKTKSQISINVRKSKIENPEDRSKNEQKFRQSDQQLSQQKEVKNEGQQGQGQGQEQDKKDFNEDIIMKMVQQNMD